MKQGADPGIIPGRPLFNVQVSGDVGQVDLGGKALLAGHLPGGALDAGITHVNSPIAKSWIRSLQARNLSPRTIKTYRDSILDYERHAPNLLEATRWDIEEYISHLLETRSPGTALIRYKAVKLFYDWCVSEEELPVSPAARVKPPTVPETETRVFTPTEIKALLEGATNRRNRAIVALLVDSGIRIGELSRIELDDLDLDSRTVLIHGKGRKTRVVAFGHKTALALDRYLRIRSLPSGQESLFGLKPIGIDDMLRRLGRTTGIEGVHAHRFRHTFAHTHLMNGGSEGDLMALAGWKSRKMIDRYAKSQAQERSLRSFKSGLDSIW